MSGVFAGNQWTTASGSNWNVVIGPSFLTEVSLDDVVEISKIRQS